MKTGITLLARNLVVVASLFWVTFFFCATASLADTDSDSAIGDKWALVVGVSRFKNPAINQLRFAAKDAKDFADYLVREGNFAPDHVKILCDEQATQKQILSDLGSRWLPRVAAPDDLVVIFISSHGSPAEMDVQGVNYIVANDTDPEDLYTTAIEMQDLVNTISRRVHAKRIVLLLDSCHSGAANAGSKGLKRAQNIDVEKVPLGNGQVVISSSQSDQVSWELKEQPNGAFTKCLLDVLRKQKDCPIVQVFKNLQDSVQQTVLRERGALQTPVLKNNWKGRSVPLDVKPSNPHPGLDTTTSAATTTTAENPFPNNLSTSSTPSNTIPSGNTTASSNPAGTSNAAIASSTANQGHVEKSSLPDSIAIMPVQPIAKVVIQQPPPGSKVLWGQLKSASELSGVPNKFAGSVFAGLRSKFGSHVLGPQTVNSAIIEARINPTEALRWTEAQWKEAGEALQAKYIVVAKLEEADWATSMMANKYGLLASGKLISGDTGRVISEVNGIRVKKAPFQGDVGGAAKYFENTVAHSAAKDLAEALISALKKDGLAKD